jgi:type IV secretory pathway VirB10-like protein
MSRKGWAYSALAVLVLVVALLAARRFYYVGRQYQTTATQLEMENRELRLKLEQATKSTPPPPVAESEVRQPSARPPEPKPSSPAVEQPPAQSDPGPSQAAVAELRERIRELESAVSKAQDEQRRLASSAADLEKTLADRAKTLEDVDAQAKSALARREQQEAANKALREEVKVAESKAAAHLAGWSREVEDLNRRREQYLTGIFRRYGEITELYRVLATRLANPREQQAPPTTELARIQNAITMAEEDLRQLRHLDVQAANLARKYRQ